MQNVGLINIRFIDCGGTVRNETVITMQLWESIDEWHILEPSKLISIIELSQDKLDIGDHEIEIEYQGSTIGKYHVNFQNGYFQLIVTSTACLAYYQCGIPLLEKVKEKNQRCCTPNSGCC